MPSGAIANSDDKSVEVAQLNVGQCFFCDGFAKINELERVFYGQHPTNTAELVYACTDCYETLSEGEVLKE